MRDIILIDDLPPLSLTSDKSTECYRNWWPGPGDAMVRFMNHSIDLLDNLARTSGNMFNLNRRGYLYLTAIRRRFRKSCMRRENLLPGRWRFAGASRRTGRSAVYSSHPTSFEDQPSGADLILDPGMIRKYFPYISENTVAALHARRAGWFSANNWGLSA